jgi:hypothetical protein
MLDLVFGGRNLIFESPLSVEEATARLHHDIAAPEWRVYENRQQPFIGTFADGRFHVARRVRGKNSFRSMIDGQLSPSVNGCRVNVRLKLPAVAVVACALFITIGAGLGTIAVPHVMAARDPITGLFGLIGPLMLLTAAVAPILEARKATRLLGSTFQSEPSRAASV